MPIFICQDLFVHASNKDIMREYLCDCEECLSLNFFSCVKNTSRLMENKNNDTSDSESCLRDEENGPTNTFEFATIP